ncbi:MAG: cytochrome c oxidase accessory protein CcoG [Proteobacteria bacterium]|nr:cytochrome c oxidase accessory protein CcoG [Pseudomonadota bacterium]
MSKAKLEDIPVNVVNNQGGFEEISLYAKHRKLYPRWINGIFNKWRIFFVVATQLFFYGMPWLSINDRQALLFDLAQHKFYIFWLVFFPQDFIYLTALLLMSAIGLFVWTSVGGRLWCGYACPQTVYTEIFLWIEKWVEGDRPARIKLDNGPLDARKLRLKAAKHTIWLVFSLWTGFTFVGYFTPIRTLWQEATSFGLGPWEAFWVFFYGFATYGNAGWLREQVCKYMCPYARFQSAMFDADTLIISYDTERGEPRGRKKNATTRTTGDCIDCTMCVQVCPTGIDIRNGLQYECIGCAACIDACDEVMVKIGSPKGLIRYTTENALKHDYPESDFWAHIRRPRVLLYGGVLLLVTLATVVSLYLRQPLKLDVNRDRGTLSRETADGLIENSYRLQLQNASENTREFIIRAEGLPNLQVVAKDGGRFKVKAADMVDLGFTLQTDAENAQPGSHPVKIIVIAADDPATRTEAKTSFYGR